MIVDALEFRAKLIICVIEMMITSTNDITSEIA